MKFLLNDTLIEDSSVASDFSALRYLREKCGLTGTKEGCGSGDCGACTLLVGRLVDGALQYQTINSCITPVQSLEACHVVSVEHLSHQASSLHPAQQAMVDCHGSQCGFCTPGIVLSLTSLFEDKQGLKQDIDRQSVCDAISGNLCRCTGYRPIIEAGLAMGDLPHGVLLAQNADVKQQLSDFAEPSSITGNYSQPQNLAQFIQARTASPEASLVAGATDLMLENTQAYRDFDNLIDVSQIAEMKAITQQGDTLSIGAAVTYSELESFCQDQYEPIHLLLSRIASRQIRNRGTLGGNVANGSPIADMPPLLLALDADIQLLKTDGTTRIVNINEFYLGYKSTQLMADEVIVDFQVALSKLAQFQRYYKVSKRMEDDISSVMLAVRFEIEDDKLIDARLAFGGMAATPIRAVNAEQALMGHAIGDEQALLNALQAVASELTPLSDVRASSAYRIDMARNLIRKAWLEAAGHSVVTFSGHQVPEAVLAVPALTGKGGQDHA